MARVAIKLWASQRLDLAVAIAMQALVPAPAGLGIALSRGVRLLVAARAARGSRARQASKVGWLPCATVRAPCEKCKWCKHLTNISSI